MKSFIVTDEMNGWHVVKASAKAFPGLKTADLYKALKHKDIRVDGKKISFSSMPKGHKTPKLSDCKRVESRKTIICSQIVTGVVI